MTDNNAGQPTEPSYYNAIQLNDELAGSRQCSDNMTATGGQATYEAVDNTFGQAANYDDVNERHLDIYEEITDGAHYRTLELSRQVDYEELSRLQSEVDEHYQPLNRTEQYIYESC